MCQYLKRRKWRQSKVDWSTKQNLQKHIPACNIPGKFRTNVQIYRLRKSLIRVLMKNWSKLYRQCDGSECGWPKAATDTINKYQQMLTTRIGCFILCMFLIINILFTQCDCAAIDSILMRMFLFTLNGMHRIYIYFFFNTINNNRFYLHDWLLNISFWSPRILRTNYFPSLISYIVSFKKQAV